MAECYKKGDLVSITRASIGVPAGTKGILLSRLESNRVATTPLWNVWILRSWRPTLAQARGGRWERRYYELDFEKAAR